ncbi:uncharacterized protein TrAFT101_002550 [Trichoderma asperellum]|uniref:uncharacterized protein n=1 Tax=Trichoderma asperellum TaxID=101201 RepID=UPI00331E7C08|nr:hypothetical protein TrAFT101_002550 [Trichoderma asperellum]
MKIRDSRHHFRGAHSRRTYAEVEMQQNNPAELSALEYSVQELRITVIVLQVRAGMSSLWSTAKKKVFGIHELQTQKVSDRKRGRSEDIIFELPETQSYRCAQILEAGDHYHG